MILFNFSFILIITQLLVDRFTSAREPVIYPNGTFTLKDNSAIIAAC